MKKNKFTLGWFFISLEKEQIYVGMVLHQSVDGFRRNSMRR